MRSRGYPLPKLRHPHPGLALRGGGARYGRQGAVVGGGGPGSKSASDTGGDPLKLTKAGAVRMGDSELEGRNHPGHWSDKKV